MSTPMAVKAPVRILGGLLVTVLVLGGAYAVATKLARAERTERLTVASAGVQTLVASTDVGSLSVEPSTASDRVEVQLHREGAWRLPRFEERRVGDTLHLEASCARHWFGDCSTQMVLRVPEGMHLETSSSVGEVSVRGAYPSVTMETSTGRLAADQLRASRVRATSSVGEVSITLASPADSVAVTTSVGDVLLVVPDDGTSYDVQAQTSMGETHTTVPVSSASAHHIRVTSSVGDVRVGTSSDQAS
ncbi:MAG: DUF4097 family beta strand repeat-containing protein [Actinomycetes bacterium]